MIVEPELPDHPDYLLLKKAVGDCAMESLIRLWGHCQSNRRGENWAGKGLDYVETVARWDGERGALFRALQDYGWIEVINEGVRIHNWEKMNAKLIASRSNGGKGGRPNKHSEKNPSETQAKPNTTTTTTTESPSKNGGSTATLPKPNGNPTETQPQPESNPHVTRPSSLSGLSIQSFYSEATRLIGVLNQVTGSKFNPPLPELEQIVARLQETGGDSEGVEKMLRRQTALWQADAKSRAWLKPGTLFGANFHDYYGQREQPVATANAGGYERKTRGQQTADRTELLETLAATRAALEENPADAGLQSRVRELEMQTA